MRPSEFMGAKRYKTWRIYDLDLGQVGLNYTFWLNVTQHLNGSLTCYSEFPIFVD